MMARANRGLRMGIAVVVAAALGTALVATCPAAARGQEPLVSRQVTMSAVDAFEDGMGAWGVARGGVDGRGVVLYSHTLIEDDGPGIGSDSEYLKNPADKSPVLTIGGLVMLKKVFTVDRPEAAAARLFVTAGLRVEVNGSPVETNPRARYPEIPAALLRRGDNEVILSAPEGETRSVKVARRADILTNDPERRGAPGRSFVSDDGGKTWKPVDGEAMIRLHLVQYRAEGDFISPVIDLSQAGAGDAKDESPLAADVAVRSLGVRADAETPKGASVELAVRTGPSPLYEAASWSDWQAAGDVKAEGHRYAQWKATLRTERPTETPVLRSVVLEAAVEPKATPAWAASAKATQWNNPPVLYTSMPFAYEDYDNAKLKQLRGKYKLDEVVAEGKTEFEQMVMLRNWVSNQWKYNPPFDTYPHWDAMEIMDRKIGFCVQYAVTYMQCCLAMGYQARFVFGYQPGMGAGHEVNEVWSNEYRKWVFMDANANRHHVDPATNEPLSMMEIHDRMLRAFYPGVEGTLSITKRSKTPVEAADIGTCRKLEIVPPTPNEPAPPVTKWPSYYKWYFMHWVPRNNFYSQAYPTPRIQGWNWDWTGYWIWEDPRLDTPWKYGNLTRRMADLYWTLGEVRYGATWRPEEGLVEVRMSTVTPGFETFVVSTDGKNAEASAATYAWKLHEGTNRLEMRSRNKAGVEGPASFLEVAWGGK